MVICIEALYVFGAKDKEREEEKRNLSYEKKYKIVIGLSMFIFLLFAIFLLSIVNKGIKNIRKLKADPQKSLVITQGLNKRRLCFSRLYFFHYFFIRTFICLMVLITPFASSKILWLIVLIIQTIFTFMHLIKLYDAWSLYLQAFV